MKVTLNSVLRTSYDGAVENVKTSILLRHVAYPLVIFEPLEGKFPIEWEKGTYWTKISLLGCLPFPKQAIVISYPESNQEFILRDNGHSTLIKKWDHFITIKKKSEHEVFYQDSIEVKAGVLTPFIWLFALIFYSYRQFRLRNLANNQFKDIQN